MSNRLRELAVRLVASGPKASHVSASETHEISEGLVEALDEVTRLQKLNAELWDIAESRKCEGGGTNLCHCERLRLIGEQENNHD